MRTGKIVVERSGQWIYSVSDRNFFAVSYFALGGIHNRRALWIIDWLDVAAHMGNFATAEISKSS